MTTRSHESEPNTFVDRDEVELLRAALDRSRLVTLLGPGGAGKTRLSRRLLVERRDIVFCDLSQATQARDVVARLGDALGVSTATMTELSDAVAAVAEAVDDLGSTVVVLDNFEQIVEHAQATVGAWLTQTVEASWVVTSREALHLAGERIVRVGPLEAPEALELLVDRVDELGRGEATGDRKVLVQLVNAVDRLALAIELLANQVSLLGPPAVLDRIEKHLSALSTERRDAPERHTSLHNTVEWSWNLLSEGERSVLAQATVFRGGFTPPAAEAVIDAGPVDLLSVLQSLESKSLLYVTHPGPRFRMHNVIRAFAEQRLQELGRSEETSEAHAKHFAGLSEHLALRATPVRETRTEADNLQAAFGRSLSQDRVRIGLALDRLLSAVGPRAAHLELLEQVVAASDDGEAELHARALCARANAQRNSDPSAAESDYSQALAIARDLPKTDLLVSILYGLGGLRYDQADLEGADDLRTEAVDIARTLPNHTGFVGTATSLAWTALMLGDAERCTALLGEAEDLARQHPSRRALVSVLRTRAFVAMWRGEAAEAQALLELALAGAKEEGVRRLEAIILNDLGQVLADQETSPTDAADRFQQAGRIFQELGEPLGALECQGWLGVLELDHDHPETAAQLLRTVAASTGRIRGDLLAGVQHFLAMAEHRQGRLEIALSEVDRGLAQLERAANRRVEFFLLTEKAALLADLGRGGEATKALEAATPLTHHTQYAHADAILRARAAHNEGEASRQQVIDELQGTPRAQAMLLRIAVRTLEGAKPTAHEARTLKVALDHSWFEPPAGERQDLRRYPTLRRVFTALVNNAGKAPVTMEGIVEAGWPGERILPEAASNRVYVTIAKLRKRGLGGIIETGPEGYTLSLPVELV